MPSSPVSEGPRGRRPACLGGLRVLLTRPRLQCGALIAMLEARGADARCLPVIEIEAPSDAGPAMAALERVDRFDVAVFTSANAVRGALTLKPDLPSVVDLPALAAVGPATQRALEEAKMSVAICPSDDYNSDGLLRHPSLQASSLRGKQVLIVKGAGGRSVIAAGLEAAGARVTSVDVYRRSRPKGRIPQLLDEPLSGFDLMVLTSGTAIEHLLELASGSEKRQILDMPMVVSSERIARVARGRGARHTPVVAPGPEDRSLMEAIENWAACRAGKSK